MNARRGRLRLCRIAFVVSMVAMPSLMLTSCSPSPGDQDMTASSTPVEIVRAFLIESVRPDLSPVGEWDEEMAEAFQVAVLALQMHPVWGEGCERFLGHRDGVYTQALEVHLHAVIRCYPGEAAPQELARVLDAIAELKIVEPSSTVAMLPEGANRVAATSGGPAQRLGIWNTGIRYRATPDTYTVKAGDSLAGISSSVYGNAWHSSRIYNANRDVLAAPDALRVGMVLRLPEASPADSQWKYLNREGVPIPQWKAPGK